MKSTIAQFRKIHHKIAPILFLPLVLSALTGIGYRVGKTWFGLSKDFGNIMMTLHEGQFLGKPLVPVYVLFTGLGLLSLTATGVGIFRRKRSKVHAAKFSIRSLHRWLGPVFFLPFLVTATTGIAYRVGKAWFGLPPEYTKLLLRIHQGTYLGSTLRVYYILFIGLGMLAMLITGIQMTSVLRKRRSLQAD